MSCAQMLRGWFDVAQLRGLQIAMETMVVLID
jgi:hypothetical protein